MTLFGKFVMGFFLILIGTGVFFGVTSYVRHDAEASMMQEVTEQKGDEVKKGSEIENKKAFGDLVAEGGPFVCLVTRVSSGVEEKGTIHASDAMLKAEFASSTTIVRDGYTYTWSIATSTTSGYKVKKIEQGTSTEKVKQLPNYWDNDLITDYNCDTWVEDISVFSLPKSVTFVTQ